MRPSIYVRRFWFYWAAWSSWDLSRTVRSMTREGAIAKARAIPEPRRKWELVR